MDIERLDIDGPLIVTPRRFGDDRGWFSETWNAARMAEAGLVFDFVQDNHAFSREPGVLRGLHCQAAPHAQTKLVRCVTGRIFDVVVDARPGSPSFGAWRGVELSAENGRQMLAPRGFLHGYLTLTPDTHVSYKVDSPYDPASDRAVAWNDPTVGVDWPLAAAGVDAPVLSAKDAGAGPFTALEAAFAYDASNPYGL